jgi:pentatricopeptide repeat protein
MVAELRRASVRRLLGWSCLDALRRRRSSGKCSAKGQPTLCRTSFLAPIISLSRSRPPLLCLTMCAPLHPRESSLALLGVARSRPGTTVFLAVCSNTLQADCTSPTSENTEVWNTMITEFVQNGEFVEAIDLFIQLLKSKEVSLDVVTFLSVLTTASQSQDGRLGQQLHGYLIKGHCL